MKRKHFKILTVFVVVAFFCLALYVINQFGGSKVELVILDEPKSVKITEENVMGNVKGDNVVESFGQLETSNIQSNDEIVEFDSSFMDSNDQNAPKTLESFASILKYFPEELQNKVTFYNQKIEHLSDKRALLQKKIVEINGYLLRNEDPPNDLVEQYRESRLFLQEKAVSLGKEAQLINLAIQESKSEIIARYENEKKYEF